MRSCVALRLLSNEQLKRVNDYTSTPLVIFRSFQPYTRGFPLFSLAQREGSVTQSCFSNRGKVEAGSRMVKRRSYSENEFEKVNTLHAKMQTKSHGAQQPTVCPPNRPLFSSPPFSPFQSPLRTKPPKTPQSSRSKNAAPLSTSIFLVKFVYQV